jgi:competence protein ComEC
VIVVVVQDPTSAQVCREDVVVVTARELATGGAVEITLSANGPVSDARVRRAVAEPLRPWHDHRQFSRAARGLGPPERRTVSPAGPVPEEAAGGAGQ